MGETPRLKGLDVSDLVGAFLKINSELRQANATTIAELTAKSAPTKLWSGPFVQLGKSLSHPVEGLGLGLAIARDLARGMGGELVVVSAPGQGTTFSLSLPRG